MGKKIHESLNCKSIIFTNVHNFRFFIEIIRKKRYAIDDIESPKTLKFWFYAKRTIPVFFGRHATEFFSDQAEKASDLFCAKATTYLSYGPIAQPLKLFRVTTHK